MESIPVKNYVKRELEGWKAIEILWLIIASVTILGLSIYWNETVLGIIGALTGVICVILTGKGKMSCYIFGLVNTVIYAYIAFGAQYYGEVILNLIYYVPMQFVGWFMWKKHISEETSEVVKERLNLKWQLIIALATAVAVYGFGLFLKKLGGELPFVDSMSTVLSIVAMILSVKRYMEQWILWIVVDVVTIVMWAIVFARNGESIATLIMWSVYLLNAIFMFVKWYRESKAA